jgi:two-component system, LytTR family, sensor histidine kinase AlgZ
LTKIQLSLTLLRRVILISLIWFIVCAFVGMANYADLQRRQLDVTLYQIWYSWIWATIPYFVFTILLQLLLDLHKHFSTRPLRLVPFFVMAFSIFMPLEMLFQIWLNVHDAGLKTTQENMVMTFNKMQRIGFIIDAILFLANCAAIAAAHLWQRSADAEKAMQRTNTDNLNLRLELEQQKLNALRAQLEPHFLFNALNAISALVRAEEKRCAIHAIAKVSDLLRYAVMASQNNWVYLSQELQFVRDYLDMQQLRYGDRLNVTFQLPPQLDAHIECPPLLLQPLLENALRHDLDCHQGHSDICVDLQITDGQLLLNISNAFHEQGAVNPGLGLGLANTKARLMLLYRGAASLQTQVVQQRFYASLSLPLQVPEMPH